MSVVKGRPSAERSSLNYDLMRAPYLAVTCIPLIRTSAPMRLVRRSLRLLRVQLLQFEAGLFVSFDSSKTTLALTSEVVPVDLRLLCTSVAAGERVVLDTNTGDAEVTQYVLERRA